jgi:hypothetical protein
MDRECFICLEPNKVVNSRERAYYIKKYKYTFECKCITYTHEKCMQRWIVSMPICPICREKLHVKKNLIVTVLDVFKKIIIIFVKVCIVFVKVCILFCIIIFGVKYIFTTVKDNFDTRNCRM